MQYSLRHDVAGGMADDLFALFVVKGQDAYAVPLFQRLCQLYDLSVYLGRHRRLCQLFPDGLCQVHSVDAFKYPFTVVRQNYLHRFSSSVSWPSPFSLQKSPPQKGTSIITRGSTLVAS